MRHIQISIFIIWTSSHLISLFVFLLITNIVQFTLINCDATLYIINDSFIKQLNLKTQLCLLTQISLVDERIMTFTNQKVMLIFFILDTSHTEIFLIMFINIHQLILKMSWLKHINSHINWKLKIVEFNQLTLKQVNFKQMKLNKMKISEVTLN
jgi:hypothetical protein